MKRLYFILQEKRKRFIPVCICIAGIFGLLPAIGQAQGLEVVNYIYSLAGNHVVVQAGHTIKPNQEIKYVLEVRNTSTQTFGSARIEINIPYLAGYYIDTVEYYHGTLGTSVGSYYGLLQWNFSSIPTVHRDTVLARIIYTLVSSSDCYALNANCDLKITVTGTVTGTSSGTPTPTNVFAYGRWGEQTATATTVAIDADDFLNSSDCAGKKFREYVYLEDQSGSTTIPLIDIQNDFPVGATFYDTIDINTGATIGTARVDFPTQTAGKESYFAWSSVGCYQKFYINVLDTSDIVYCAGAKLTNAVVWAEDWDALLASDIDPDRGWYLGTEPIELDDRELALADTNKLLTYQAKTACGPSTDVTSNAVKIIVHDKPQIVKFTGDSVYCDTEKLSMGVDINANDDAARVSYEWVFKGNPISTAATVEVASLTVADSGQYLKVIITNSCGVSTDSVKIKVKALPVVTIDGDNAVCEDGQVQLTGYDNGVAVSGTWTSLDPDTATVDANGLVTGVWLGKARIKFTVTNGSGCTDSKEYIITVDTLPKVSISGGEDPVCEKGTLTLVGTPAATLPEVDEVRWRSANELIATVDSQTGVVTGVSESEGEVDIYYVVRLSTGCTDSNSVKIKVKPLPNITIDPVSPICSTQLVTLSVTPGGGSWKSVTPTYASVNETTGEVKGGSAGDAIIRYTVTNGGCIDSADITIKVNALPIITIDPVSSICNKDSIILTFFPSGGSWKSVTPSIASVDQIGKVKGESPGQATIRYTVTDAITGCTDSADISIMVNASPVATITGASDICEKGELQLTGNDNGTPYVGVGESWRSDDTSKADVNSSSGMVKGKKAGDPKIWYKIEYANGCTDSFAVNIKVKPLPVVTITGNGPICEDGQVQLTGYDNGIVHTTGEWKSTDPAIASVTGGMVTGESAGTATIRYIVTNGDGCTDSAEVSIKVNHLPQVTITGVADICEQGTVQLTGNDDGDPVSGIWTSLDTDTATVNVSGLVTGVKGGKARIRFTVTNANGCTDSDTVLVKVDTLPKVTITPNSVSSICNKDSITLTGSPVGGSWKSVTPSFASVDQTGKVKGESDGLATIRYTVTDATTGCTDSADISITVNASPVATITGVSAICEKEEVQLTGNDNGTLGVGGSWRSDDTSKADVSISGMVKGKKAGNPKIWYKIEYANGCMDSNFHEITVKPLPVIAINPVSSICNKDTITLTVTSSVPGEWKSATPSIASVDQAGKVIGLTAGTATIRYIVTNGEGCTDSAEVEIIVNPLPVVSIEGYNSICLGTTTQLLPKTGGTWVSNNPSVATVNSAGVVLGVTTGSATFTFTSSTTNCSSTTGEVTVGNFPVVAPITGRTALCVDTVIELSCVTTGGSWRLSHKNIAEIESSTDAPVATVRIIGKAIGKSYVSYTVGTGVCQSTSTYAIKVVSSTPPKIIIGFER